MRSQIIAFLFACFLVITVNAATLNKREISPAAQKCINSIKEAGTQLEATKPDIDKFSSADGYMSALKIHNKEQLIEKLLKEANNNCCSFDRFATEEIASVLGVVTDLVPRIVEVLTSIVSKKLAFKDLTLATTIVKNDIQKVGDLTSSLTECILAKKGFLAEKIVGNTLKTQLDNAFSLAVKTLEKQA
ncbi:hypothetical protein [Parasitella parasitica]|uniref:Secreted protein n=1 Tax=Parasitella parasitica TaxID=35722 RepID=A0A0B7NV95_9FUNG|nr:hypothetical protein [Parasitella parasitica]